MAYKSDKTAPSATLDQILANSITHGIGVALSIAGLVVLIIHASEPGEWLAAGQLPRLRHFIDHPLPGLHRISLAGPTGPSRLSCSASTHSAILVLIAGTYTPFLLTQMRNGLGWTVFGIVWGAALLVLILKLALKSKFEKPPVWLYLLLGWMGVLVFLNTFRTMGQLSIWFLLIGGIFYSVGVIFYRWKSLPFAHAIWHIFVILGSTFHYFSVLYLA